jgi:hypothetical protein
MDKKDDFLEVRISRPDLELLDYFAGLCRTNRSSLVRRLIPCRAVIEAVRHFYEAHDLDTKNMADEFTGRAVTFLEQQMIGQGDSCISYQVQFVCRYPDRVKKVAELFCKWSQAVRDIAGYRLDPICVRGEVYTHVAVGPDDSSDYIELVKDECQRLLEKSAAACGVIAQG